jgi:hypothetical protein
MVRVRALSRRCARARHINIGVDDRRVSVWEGCMGDGQGGVDVGPAPVPRKFVFAQFRIWLAGKGVVPAD